MSLELAVRAAVLLAAGTAIGWAARSMSPAARHAFWHATVIAALALPVTSLMSPAWGILATPTRPAAAARDTTRDREAAEPAALAAVSIWVGGSGLVACYFLSGYGQLWRLRRRARPAPPAWNTTAARLSARGRITREVEVFVSPHVRGPLVTGVGKAAVLIPPEACLWSDVRREAVLIHELAHVSRRDLPAQFAAQALATLHWFNPLAWHALREMRRARELACDEAVLRAGVAPLAYATELLAIASAGAALPAPASALSMARSSELEDRLSALLAPQPTPARGVSGGALALLTISASITVAGAHLTPPGSSAEARSRSRTAGWTMLDDGGQAATRDADLEGATAASGPTRERSTLLLGMTPGNQVIPPLLEALGDPDARVREKAAVGLTWRRDGRVGPALVAAASDPSPSVREKVLVALAFSDEPRAAAVIDAARSDPDAGVRAKARTLTGK